MSAKTRVIVVAGLLLALFFLLLTLGFWQLGRAEEKSLIAAMHQNAIEQKPLWVSGGDVDDLPSHLYRLVKLTGRYDGAQQLIYDNQTYHGQAGYYVLTPFLIKDSQHSVLVNRGFVAWQGTRDKLADITIDNAVQTILVQIAPIKTRLTLREAKFLDTYPLLIQTIDIKALAEKTNLNLLPILTLLQAGQKQGYLRDWQPFYGSVVKHQAYAFQWFTMAMVLLILSFILWRKYRRI